MIIGMLIHTLTAGLLIALLCAIQSRADKQKTDSRASSYINPTLRVGSKQIFPNKVKFILGVSTGHAGSTSVHHFLIENLSGQQCPLWNVTGEFEKTVSGEEKNAFAHGMSSNYSCAYTKAKFIPYVDKIKGTARTWVDLGHFHNTGPILECLADMLREEVVYIRIRRNRYDIAYSFMSAPLRETPCHQASLPHPFSSYCPIDDTVTPIALPVLTDVIVWKHLTPFQRFLWWADELEYRYYLLQQNNPSIPDGPTYLEVTWNDSEELTAGLQKIASQLGCESGAFTVSHERRHVHKTQLIRNCTAEILQDLEYRKLASFSQEQWKVLFAERPQHIDTRKCNETKQQLEDVFGNNSTQHLIFT